MANRWTLKKKASEEIIIPNSKVGIYCSVYQSVFDNSINATLNGTLIGGANNNTYVFDENNKYKYPNKKPISINTYKLKEEVMNELKPYIEELGNKFDEIMKSKGFIKK